MKSAWERVAGDNRPHKKSGECSQVPGLLAVSGFSVWIRESRVLQRPTVDCRVVYLHPSFLHHLL